MPLTLRLLFRRALLPAAACALLLSGCESDRPFSRNDRAGDRAKREPLPPLVAQENFFAGAITAELRTGSGFGDAGKADEPGSDRSKGSGGFRMGGGGGGGGHRHGGDGGGYGNEPSVSDNIDNEQVANLRRAAANGTPPIVIHLRFTNHGTGHADLLITDFLSPLGNFVVEPEKLALEPGQSLEVEPMTSRVVDEFSQAEVILTLRLNGHSERKTLTLTLAPAPEPAAVGTTAATGTPETTPSK